VAGLVAVLAIAAAYMTTCQNGIPKPGGLVGHSLGVLGFLMMLSTETLYSLRKRLHAFTYGRMSAWLQWHVFTGLVGPFLVLLHAGWKFNGLAGLLTLLTLVMVASGIFGRYIYTAVPRTLDGAALGGKALQERIAAIDCQLRQFGVDVLALTDREAPPGSLAVLGRPWLCWRHKRRLRRALRQLKAPAPARQLQTLLHDRHRLLLQADSLSGTRRLLALWHVFHQPLGVIVFSLAFVHIGAALYFTTFLK
jgi:hypothetical protein